MGENVEKVLKVRGLFRIPSLTSPEYWDGAGGGGGGTRCIR